MKNNIVCLVGVSGTGKSTIIKHLNDYKVPTYEMDSHINTFKKHTLADCIHYFEKLSISGAKVSSVSVIADLVSVIRDIKNDELDIELNPHIVYLRTTDKNSHLLRLNQPETLNNANRPTSNIASAVRTAKTWDNLYLGIADTVINVDKLSSTDISQIVRIIYKSNEYIKDQDTTSTNQKLNLITRNMYDFKVSNLEGPHWMGAGKRWSYHAQAAKWIDKLKLSDANKILEIGCMGVQVVQDSITMDYDAAKNNKDWITNGFKSTYIHDAKNMPWPFEKKRFDMVIALRVLHHLVPKQKEVFLEIKKVSKKLILVVPDKKTHIRGVDKEDLIEWNNGQRPSEFIKYNGELGCAYLFEWE